MRLIEDALEMLDALNSQGGIEYSAYSQLYDTISMIDAELVKHGRIRACNGYTECSLCAYDEIPYDANYCPNCGAKFDEVEDGKNG